MQRGWWNRTRYCVTTSTTQATTSYFHEQVKAREEAKEATKMPILCNQGRGNGVGPNQDEQVGVD